ncbi:antibiotic biosynthesis monooxygenase [Pseudomonas hormoni]|uniref:Antibiotic biosynthesis monooxygenase n=1 Tax=Pseudomonas hormoni TaxID=3093767 RepID=A0ABX8ERA7_9PSED|nr:antibiotic biosynthesis monooxygenase [Pseudomonas hormoni]QVW21895.1 antibiotic biosynthesis monooxygenase [Pseudomonas hormoni]
MVSVALFVEMKAKPGKEAEVDDFLRSALPLANAETGTTSWFALKMSTSVFGIFDAFANNEDRDAHLNGPIAQALMSKAGYLLSEPPSIQKVDVLAAKG